MISKKILLAIILSCAGFFFFSNSTHAAIGPWPGNTYDTDPNNPSNLRILLSRTFQHPAAEGGRVVFAIYSTTPGDVRVTINNVGSCDLGDSNDAKKVRVWGEGLSAKGTVFETCNKQSGEITVNISNNAIAGVTYGNEKKPLYEGIINADLDPDSNNSGTFGFRARSDEGKFFGFKQAVNSSLAIDSTNGPSPYGSRLNDLKIPVGYCSADLTDKNRKLRVKIYDPDNFQASYAQNIGPNGSYVPLKIGVFQNTFLPVDGYPGPQSQWEYFYSNKYIASKDDASATVKYVSATIQNRSLPSIGASSIRIKDMGSGNYVVLGIFSVAGLFGLESPLDEVYANPDVHCDPPPCYVLGNCPPPPETWRWKMNPSITGFNNQVTFTGQTPPKATYNNNLEGTVTSMGSGDGEGNVTGGKKYVDVNLSMTRNGVELVDDFYTRWQSLDQGNGTTNKPEMIQSADDIPGKYCAQMFFPDGELGRSKNNIPNVDPESSESTLDATNEKVRRFRYFYNSGWKHASTKTDTKTFWGFNSGNPTQWSSDGNDSTHWWSFYGHLNGFGNSAGGNNAFATQTPQYCAWVVDVDPNPVDNFPYEKGQGGQVNFGVKVDTGGANDVPVTDFTWSWVIKGLGAGGSDISGTVYTNTRDAGASSTITLDSTAQDRLNNSTPGTRYQFIITANGKQTEGWITVIEVPFARFYGNDVYSTSRSAGGGKLRFNDSDNANAGTYQERGSVAQYAAFAAGSATNYLDTAAFRYFGSALNPKPATGLLSEGSELSDISAENVYSKITQSKPEDCLDNYSNVNGQLTNNAISRLCYDLDNATPLNATPQPGNFDYRKKITVFYNNDIYITKNIINTTPSANRTDPEQTAVALFVGNNIYIDKSVTRIDAILVAQNTIDTCYNTTGNSPIANTDLEDTGQCRNKLVINGSVSAKTVKFKRVGGSRYLAPVGTLPGNAVGSGVIEKDGETNLPLNSGLSAEIINFPAYLYWAQPYLFNESTSGGKVNSIYTAPPRQ